MDKDRDGYLSVEDLCMSSRDAGLKIKRRDLQVCKQETSHPPIMKYFLLKQNMISEADKNGDGMVSEQEFVEVMLKTCIFNYD